MYPRQSTHNHEINNDMNENAQTLQQQSDNNNQIEIVIHSDKQSSLPMNEESKTSQSQSVIDSLFAENKTIANHLRNTIYRKPASPDNTSWNTLKKLAIIAVIACTAIICVGTTNYYHSQITDYEQANDTSAMDYGLQTKYAAQQRETLADAATNEQTVDVIEDEPDLVEIAKEFEMGNCVTIIKKYGQQHPFARLAHFKFELRGSKTDEILQERAIYFKQKHAQNDTQIHSHVFSVQFHPWGFQSIVDPSFGVRIQETRPTPGGKLNVNLFKTYFKEVILPQIDTADANIIRFDFVNSKDATERSNITEADGRISTIEFDISDI